LTEVEGRQEVTDFLDGLTSGAGSLGIITAAILLYSASSTVGAMRHAVQTANEDGRSGPSFPKNKGLDILITLVTLPVMLILVALSISRPLARAVDDSQVLSDLAAIFGGPLAIGLLGLLLLGWMFWVLNPGRSDWLSAFVGALTGTLLVTGVSFGLNAWFEISGGGSAVYGFLAAFIGVLLFLNLASMAIVFGAHIAAAIRSRPWEKLPESGSAP
jgi:membrane protein